MQGIQDANKSFIFEGEENGNIGFGPHGIAYNNIQITYRNTSLKSSTKEEKCVICLQMGPEKERK